MTTTLPAPRGPVSTAVIDALTGRGAGGGHEVPLPGGTGHDFLLDDDAQLALWVLYALHYVPLQGVADDQEWDPGVLAMRRALERRLLEALREVTEETVATASRSGDLGDRIFEMTDDFDGPALAAYLQRRATREQYVEFLVHKSAYGVRESDPQAFALPRLTAAPKVALAELLYDEFGAGRAEREHGSLFAAGLAAAGLDPAYGALVDALPGSTLVHTNAMNLFNLHRALLPAAVGHFAAFEATSSEPSRKLAAGAERLGLPAAVVTYFDEHVEADAVHEQLMVRAVCAALVAQHPGAEQDLLMGAASCLVLDSLGNAPLLEAFERGESSLRPAATQRLAS